MPTAALQRSNDWIKLKLERQQEFVIGGYRPAGASGIGALLVGYYEGEELRFAGKVRASLLRYVRQEVLGKLKPLQVPDSPALYHQRGDTARLADGAWRRVPSPS
jgi:bifunctional non-homologous end joining protein LigD